MTLDNARILITRPAHQVDEFARLVEKYGGIPVKFPVLEIKPLDFEKSLKEELKKSYRWIVFTSVNGVRFSFKHVKDRFTPEIKICAIGPATARAIEEMGGRVDFVPDKYVSSEIARLLPIKEGDRVLLLRAKIAPSDLRKELIHKGAEVVEIPVYDTVEKIYPPEEVQEKIFPVPDFITFTSSSTFRAFIKNLENAGIEPQEIFREGKIAVIGPVTAQAVRSSGFEPDVIAKEHTLEGLLKAISAFLKEVRV